MTAWLFDALLAASLLWLGWRAVASPQLFRAIVFFMLLGLVMALCWARLAAPDVALAEAAIGAGLTGALLFEAYYALPAAQQQDRAAVSMWPALLLLLLCSLLVGGLIWALLAVPAPVANLAVLVETNLAASGVSNPVTAVLLNFRGYDTLLEIAVLLLALLGVWTVHASAGPKPLPSLAADSALADSLLHWLLPPTVLIALYLLWAGAHAPGGAFQAGATLAAIGVMLRLTERITTTPETSIGLKYGLSVGLGIFSLVACSVMVTGGNLLQYPLDWAKELILLIEIALTLSIALTLLLLFSGAPGLRRVR